MIVYFLRHAEAHDQAESDFARKLTDKGEAQAEKAARFCLEHGLLPDLIVTSPVVRARQTARIAAKLWDKPDLVEEHWLACGMTPETCLSELKTFQKFPSVMLVGHEPDFGETIAFLIGLPDAAGLNIRKASLTAIDLPEFESGSGQLQFSVPSRLM